MAQKTAPPKPSPGERLLSAKSRGSLNNPEKPREYDAIEYLRASLGILALINGTLDAAAEKLGPEATREMVLTLLILYKSRNGMSEEQLVKEYGAWSGEKVVKDLKDSILSALGQMRQEGLVEGKISETSEETSANVRTTKLGAKRAKVIREVINSKFDALMGSALKNYKRKKLEKLIKNSLPWPRPKPE